MYEKIHANEGKYNLIPEECTSLQAAAEYNHCRCPHRFNWAVAFVSSLSLIFNVLLVLLLVSRDEYSPYGIFLLGLLNSKSRG